MREERVFNDEDKQSKCGLVYVIVAFFFVFVAIRFESDQQIRRWGISYQRIYPCPNFSCALIESGSTISER